MQILLAIASKKKVWAKEQTLNELSPLLVLYEAIYTARRGLLQIQEIPVGKREERCNSGEEKNSCFSSSGHNPLPYQNRLNRWLLLP